MGEIVDSQQEELLHCARAEEVQQRDHQLLIAAKFGITSSSPEKSHRDGRVKEVSEFHLRNYCKTKISRGSGHYFGTFWPST